MECFFYYSTSYKALFYTFRIFKYYYINQQLIFCTRRTFRSPLIEYNEFDTGYVLLAIILVDNLNVVVRQMLGQKLSGVAFILCFTTINV